MFPFYLSISLTIISNVFYHLIQKLTPSNVNPLLTLTITYATATLICLLILPFFPSNTGISEGLKNLNWTSFGLAFAIVGLEGGFLWAYRAGWTISLGALASNVAVAVLLLPIGLLLFKEKPTMINIIGIAISILGLIMINQR